MPMSYRLAVWQGNHPRAHLKGLEQVLVPGLEALPQCKSISFCKQLMHSHPTHKAHVYSLGRDEGLIPKLVCIMQNVWSCHIQPPHIIVFFSPAGQDNLSSLLGESEKTVTSHRFGVTFADHVYPLIGVVHLLIYPFSCISIRTL